ncbi:MAG: hypothetical protein HOV86_04805 [Thermoactinospora sp.]|nr:hypothetical protein [Thermoactinospora sp.]
MPPPEVEEMQGKAKKLRDFADHVEKLVDEVRDYAGKMDWSGPLTDRVRGEIGTWRTRCSETAGKIRDEAERLDKAATDLLNPK